MAENTMLSKLNSDLKLKSNDLIEQSKEYKQKYFSLKLLKINTKN